MPVIPAAPICPASDNSLALSTACTAAQSAVPSVVYWLRSCRYSSGSASPPAPGRPGTAGFPIGPQLVVLFALLGVAEHLVGLVDFLEFFLRPLFVLGHVGMVLAGQFAKGLADVVVAGGALTPRDL